MPGQVKKPLYIGASLEDLNKKVEVPPEKGRTAKMCAKTANRVLDEAEKAFKCMDEERAYVLFMKYIALWQVIMRSNDYKQNKEFIDSLLGPTGCRKALNKAEELSASLVLRYGELEEAKEASKKLEAEKEKVKSSGPKDVDAAGGDAHVENGVDEIKEENVEARRVLGRDGVVDARELYRELDGSPDSVLVMDVRRSDHFRDSHITIGQCMSIPAEIIKPGLTASTLEKGLGEEAKALWRQRAEIEFLVLVDWDQNLSQGSNLAIVKETICRWDWGTTYKNEPLVLKGGFEDWLLKYPMYTDNPHAKKPKEKVEQSKNLLDFEYPVFDDEKKPPPPAQPAPTPPSPNENGVYQNRMFYISGKPGQSSQSGQRPMVNRAVKPSEARPPPAPDQIDSARPSARSAPAPVLAPAAAGNLASSGSATNGQSSAKPRQAPDSALQAGPQTSSATSPTVLPTVDRSLKPKPTRSAPSKDSNGPAADTSSNNSPLNKPSTDKDEAETTQREKESSAEADMKFDMQLYEELKKKEEQARKELDKMRYDKTKAENEKLKEEKAEMERNLLKLQQELLDAKTRQVQKNRSTAKSSSPPQSPTHIASSKPDATSNRGSLRDTGNKRVDTKPEVASNSAGPTAPSSTAAAAAVGKMSTGQQNQNSNAATADAKAAAGVPPAAAAPTNGAAARASTTPTAPTTLPKGWEKRWDEKSKRYYYLDHVSTKTQWHPPGSGVKDASGSASVANVSSKGKDLSGQPATSMSGQRVTRKPLKSDSSEPSLKSGGLKRSFSSPNIAQMVVNEEEEALNRPFPTVDRTTKPVERLPQPLSQSKSISQSRVRQLNPIFGSQGRALTGLRNLGNTCFMNSVIQCLSNTTPLAKYFITDKYLSDINRENPLGRGGEVAEEFAVVVRAIWTGQYRSIAPRDLRDTVTKYVPEFRKHVGHHHDSQEFLVFLLDGLHEDLNEVKRREYIKEEDFSKYPDETAAGLSWKNHEKLNRSVIVNLFQGQFKSTVECLHCHKTSVKFEAFMYLSLPIPSNSRCSLNDCVTRFSQPEKLSGDNATHCSHCKTHRNSKKTILIWRLPRILLIHLKRFYYEGMWRQKLQTSVEFPSDLNLNSYVIGPGSVPSYQLYGVSNHTGTLDGGHYTAYCKNAVSKRWYKYDDHEVYDTSPSNIKSSAAYILFYTSIAFAPP